MKLKTLLLLVPGLLCLFACSAKKTADDPLADTGRTQRTENLLANLKQIAAQGYLFGHQDDPMYGVGWVGDSARSDVKSVCDDYPAVMGFDLGHIENGAEQNLDGVRFDDMKKQILAQYDRGGMVTLSWHLDNPLTGESAWMKADSLTAQQKETVASVLEGGKMHDKFLTWLDKVAEFMNSLETPYGVKVPVLFRPWHEHNGSWFWWGRDLCTKEQYIALWKITVERLKEKNVTNVLYAYSPGAVANTEQDYMERYPGDNIVDLMGLDIYCMAAEGDVKAVKDYSATLDKSLSFICPLAAKHHKAVAVTETGYEGIPMDNWWTTVLAPVLDRHPVSYVLVWRNSHDKAGHFYAPYPGQRGAEDFVTFYNDKKSLFLHDVQGLYLQKEAH